MKRDPWIFTGGPFNTNAYLVPSPKGYLCFDAPDGLADFLREEGIQLEALILTHGHLDHVWDAETVREQQACMVYAHPEDERLLRNPSQGEFFGIPWRFRPLQEYQRLQVPLRGKIEWELAGRRFVVFHVPGHSPGSLAFYEKAKRRIFSGDVLFAGSVGRWDIPGGSRDELLETLRRCFCTLPDDTTIYPGHGPPTTVRQEKESNGFLTDFS
ncbi:MBL fold metallo-hydrolase [Candidatus Methylacidithermus pantelleriae]|uniref:Hydroxyacylglutathione hydrolase n=1 Tax=Candidatus Methylacidithermus pantelleriae TaxID=2744239 RepID=A0A8J2BJV5_9BACT|nr:MBL fold metallo-hydrolase [Candidatus Methylacidithermus pantelleriae]CAF0694009.1 Hydroxyacylglutathione hydrolase [Candidatus Methylacidithermus pantelleriae]